MGRVCIIGLDGIGIHNLKMLMKKVSIPSLEKIFKKGFIAKVRSIPPYTPIAWTTIFSSVNAGKHGIFGFLSVRYHSNKVDIHLNNANDVLYPRLFEILSFNKLKSLVFNIPFTYPTSGIIGSENMIIISDWASPKQFIHPNRLKIQYKDWLIAPPHKWYLAMNIKSYVNRVYDFLTSRLQIYYDLIDYYEDFSLLNVVFSELDWLMHKIPNLVMGYNISYVSKIIQEIDRFIGKILEKFDLVIVTSDHGFHIVNRIIGVNSLLAKLGLYGYTLNLNLSKLLRNYDEELLVLTRFTVLSNVLSKLSSRLFSTFLTLIPLNKLTGVAPFSVTPNLSYSKVMMLEPDSWGIYILKNKSSFDPHVCKIIFQRLKDLGLLKDILCRNNLFWGPYVKRSPEIFLLPNNGVSFDSSPFSRIISTEMRGDHCSQALLMMYGDHVLKGFSEKQCQLFDIAPTVLAYLGLPIPNDTDGNVLSEAFNVNLTIRKEDYTMFFRRLRKMKKILSTFT